MKKLDPFIRPVVGYGIPSEHGLKSAILEASRGSKDIDACRDHTVIVVHDLL